MSNRMDEYKRGIPRRCPTKMSEGGLWWKMGEEKNQASIYSSFGK